MNNYCLVFILFSLISMGVQARSMRARRTALSKNQFTGLDLLKNMTTVRKLKASFVFKEVNIIVNMLNFLFLYKDGNSLLRMHPNWNYSLELKPLR